MRMASLAFLISIAGCASSQSQPQLLENICAERPDIEACRQGGN